MCSSKAKTCQSLDITSSTIAQINGRPVLQPTCNRIPALERRNSLKKPSPKCLISPPPPSPNSIKTKAFSSPPISPKNKSPRPKVLKRELNEPNGLNLSVDKAKSATFSSKKLNGGSGGGVVPYIEFSLLDKKYSSSLIFEAPGSIAAARREETALLQVQRKMKIAHYGRTKSAKFEKKVVPINDSSNIATSMNGRDEKRCSFITPNSDPLYIAYHDEEWGVPIHDDKLLFELLVLSSAQAGSDWTSILKKRQDFREAFSEFDAEIVVNFNEREITSISKDYGIEISRVRGVVDNSNQILEIKRQFGSFNKYLWGFVNYKPFCSQYKSCQKIPLKTSKSESISKDLVRRGFRNVGPTVIQSFMQAAGLTNDHLITCPRHLQCITLASQHK